MRIKDRAKSKQFSVRQNSLLDSGIEITAKKVRFGNSVYQFRNVTGFSVAKLPENRIFLNLSVLFLILGILTLVWSLRDTGLSGLGAHFSGASDGENIGISRALFFCGIPSVFFGWIHFKRYKVEYALSLELNSGKEEIFVSSDCDFLKKVINKITDFIEQGAEGAVFIHDHSVRSINVSGNLTGIANVGDNSRISN